MVLMVVIVHKDRQIRHRITAVHEDVQALDAGHKARANLSHVCAVGHLNRQCPDDRNSRAIRAQV